MNSLLQKTWWWEICNLVPCILARSPCFLSWLIAVLLVCFQGMRDENDFLVEKKKNDGTEKEGVGDKKKWQRIENQWEMKYIRTPGARSTGYDLSQHTVVPHWAAGRKKWREREVGDKESGDGGKTEPLRNRKQGARWAGQERGIIFLLRKQCPPIKNSIPLRPAFAHKALDAVSTIAGHGVG